MNYALNIETSDSKMKCIAFLLGIIMLSVNPSNSQPVEIIKKVQGGYVIQIDSKDYIAVSPEVVRARRLEIDTLRIALDAANKRVEADRSLIAVMDTTVAVYRRNIVLKDSLITELEDLYIG